MTSTRFPLKCFRRVPVMRVDARRDMQSLFRGGPPWTTKLRIVVVLLPALVFCIVAGAVWGAFTWVREQVSDVAEAWRACGVEAAKRREESMREWS